MSFDAQELSVLAYANGFTHWHYRTRDSLDQLLGARGEGEGDAGTYFAAAREVLRPGDQITVNLLTPGAVGLAQLAVIQLPETCAPRLALLAATPPPLRSLAAAA
ncbi:MAG: hypothetical protein JNL25_02950 [Rhodospirillaceae bacterium]|nr:hypothetical protein [Rhodospirillaceae bacterium]